MRAAAFGLALAAVATTGCDVVQAPVCAAVTPLHETRDGRAEAGPLANGDVAVDLLLFDTTRVDGVSADTFDAVWSVEADDTASEGDCAMSMDCGPDAFAPGDTLSCSVTDDVDGDACTFRATITLTVTRYDASVCTETTTQYQVAVEHGG